VVIRVLKEAFILLLPIFYRVSTRGVLQENTLEMKWARIIFATSQKEAG